MKNLIGLVIAGAAIAAAVVFVGLEGIKTYEANTQKLLKIEAMQTCGMSSKYLVVEEGGVEVSYPMEELYKKCMSELGY